MAILGGSGISVTDVSDAIISNGIPPRNPSNGTLWLDGKTLKKYENGNWVIQEIDVTKLDPDLTKKIEGIMDNLGTIGDDSKLTFNDRSILARELGEIIGVIPSKSTGNVYPSSLPAYNVLDSSGSGTFSNVRARAVTVGMDVNDSRYKAVETAYTSLNSYLSQYNPKTWDITTANKDKIVTLTDPDMFRQKFLDYYTAELKLATEVERVAKESAEEYVEELTDGVSLKDKTEILSGNPIFTDKADDNSVVHVEVDGKSVGGGSGKNLINSKAFKDYPQHPNYVGSNHMVLKLKPNTKYTMSTNFPIHPDGNNVIYFNGVSGVDVPSDGVPKTTTTDGEGNLFILTFKNRPNGELLYNGTYWVQLEEGVVATDYEPPAPTPGYPIAINSLNDFDVVSTQSKSTLDNTLDFYRNTDLIVTDPTKRIYADSSVPNPPVGAVFNNLNIRTNLIARTNIDFPAVHNTVMVLIKLYEKTNDVQYLNRALLIGDFVLSRGFEASFYGTMMYLIPNRVSLVGGQWKNINGEINLRTLYQALNVTTSLYRITNDTKYSVAATRLMKTIGNAHNNVNVRVTRDSELQQYMFGASYDLIYVNEQNSMVYSWMSFNQSNADILVESIKHYVAVFGNSTIKDWEDTSFTPQSIIDNFGSHIKAIHANGMLTMSGTGLPYNFFDYGTGGVNWDWVDNTGRGNKWFAGDAILWIIKGIADLGKTDAQLRAIASIYRNNFYNLIVKTHSSYPNINQRVLFYDRYNFDGTHLTDDDSLSTSSTALLWMIDEDLGIEDSSLHSKMFSTLDFHMYKNNENSNFDGSYGWDASTSDALVEVKATGEIYLSKFFELFTKEYPNTRTSDKTNISLPEPLRSVGDVKDRLFRDTDGLWKVERNVHHAEVGENAPYIQTDGADHLRIAIRGGLPNTTRKQSSSFSSTHFKYGRIMDGSEPVINNGGGNPTAFVWIKKDVLPTPDLNGFILWMREQKSKGIPFAIQYELESPTIETLPDDMQQKLNNIQSYKGSNYVYTVSPDKSDILSPTLHATFKSRGWYREFSNEAWKVESEKAQQILDKEISDMDKVTQALKNFTDTAFADGIIQIAEAQAISEHLNTLKKENADLSNQYTTIYANSNLIGSPKTNLASAKTAYNTAYTNLTNSVNTAISGNKTTPAQKTDVDNKFTSYSNALKLLTQRLNEALSAIADKIATDVATAKANVAKTEASAYADGIVTAEEQRAIADAKAKLAEAQKYADNAVEKVEVGGRNYFTKSHSFRQTTTNGTFISRPSDAPNGFYVVGNSSANGQVRIEKVITENGWWTVSFDIKGTQSSTVGMTIDICDLGSTRVLTNTTNTYRRVSVSVNVTNYSSTVYNFVDFGSIGWAHFYVDNIKVEKGNKATDWTPAPEDQEKDLHDATRLPVRYIRDWLAGSDMNNSSHWVEIQAIQNGVNVAKGTTVTSSQSVTAPTVIVDGNTASGSLASMTNTVETVPDPSTGGTKTVVTPGHVIVDLGKAYNDLESIKVWHYYTDERTYNNTLTEVSVDGENWTALYDSDIMGVYPETSQGRTYSVITNQLASNAIQHTTNLVSRVNNVEQQITADSIVSTVMAQEKFTSWQEVVDAKPTPEAFDLLSGNLSSTADAVSTIETRVTEVEQTATSWGVTLEEQQEIISGHGTTVSDIKTYMTFKDTGLEIGKSDSNMKVNISNTQIDFMDNGVSVAWINGQQLYIRNAEVLDTLVVGNHKFEKLGTNMTVISWNGE